MIGLSNERMEQILHEETVKQEEVAAILRSIYTRYMKVYEKYFSDIDALNDDEIAAMREYHEETRSLVKYYYMDIPMDVCSGIREFEEKYSDRLLASGWHEYLFGSYAEFKENSKEKNKSEEYYKAKFTKQVLKYFYDAMDYIFRDGFGTGSQSFKSFASTITGMLFKKE